MNKRKDDSAIKTLADYGYRRIRADIIAGQFAAKSKLSLKKMCDAYEIGMSPLREALTRLVGDALVVSEGQRGFWVAPLSLHEFYDITRVRTLLETEALQYSIQHGNAEWEEAVKQAFKELSAVETRRFDGSRDLASQWENANRRFHEALVSACDSPWLMRILRQLYQQSERYRRISLVDSPATRNVREEHRAIFEAVLERDVLKSCRLLEFHLNRTAQAIAEILKSKTDLDDTRPATGGAGNPTRAPAPSASRLASRLSSLSASIHKS